MSEVGIKTQIKLRLPSDMKAWIDVQATRNGASQNSEIIRCIRERMDRMTVLEAANTVPIDALLGR